MQKPFLISCAGLAKSGKNTFANLLQDEMWDRYKLKSAQLSFAYQLRKDVEEFGFKCGFDVWSDKDKEMFRPLLTWYGDFMRKKTGGQYFIEKIKTQLINLEDCYDVYLLTDLRFKEFANDELDFCKSFGPVVHISKYKMVPDREPGDDSYGEKCKEFDLPPNLLEAVNDPILQKMADYKIEWSTVGEENVHELKPHINKCVDWLEETYHISII